MTNQQTLQRFAAVIPVLVEAGCEECHWGMGIDMYLNNRSECTKDEQSHWEGLYITVLKEWFREKVVVWAYKLCEIQPPEYDGDTWLWLVHSVEGSDPDPTEAYIQCAEALARVIGGKG